MDIIILIIVGAVIGLLGKFVAPGDKDNIPIWLTILCGIGGIILGNFIYAAFSGDGSTGVDWVRWIVAVLTAAVLVVIASTVTGRNAGNRTRAELPTLKEWPRLSRRGHSSVRGRSGSA